MQSQFLSIVHLLNVVCTVHCGTIMQHKPTKCTLFKLTELKHEFEKFAFSWFMLHKFSC